MSLGPSSIGVRRWMLRLTGLVVLPELARALKICCCSPLQAVSCNHYKKTSTTAYLVAWRTAALGGKKDSGGCQEGNREQSNGQPALAQILNAAHTPTITDYTGPSKESVQCGRPNLSTSSLMTSSPMHNFGREGLVHVICKSRNSKMTESSEEVASSKPHRDLAATETF